MWVVRVHPQDGRQLRGFCSHLERILQDLCAKDSKSSRGKLRRPASTGMLGYNWLAHSRALEDPSCEQISQLYAPGLRHGWSEHIEDVVNDTAASSAKDEAALSSKEIQTASLGEPESRARDQCEAWFDRNGERRKALPQSPQPDAIYVQSWSLLYSPVGRKSSPRGYKKQAPIDRSQSTSPRTIVRTLAWAKKVTELARSEYGKVTIE